jgi:hypothetical protein
MPVLLTLLLLGSFPSASKTSWMRPESFRLLVGMTRLEVVQTLREDGWDVKPGKDANEAYVDYAPDKSLTLDFHNDRLRSIRFELFAFIPEVRTAFQEKRQHLRTARGGPKKATATLLIYDEALPNVMVVMSDDPKTANGKKGLGFLAVRYFDPR